MKPCKKIILISCLLIFGKILFISTHQMVNAAGCEETFSGKGCPFSYSAEQVAYTTFTNASALFSGDVIYTISGEIDGQSTSLDSIIFENIDNGTRSLFGELPVQTRYQINLTTNELILPTGIVNISSGNYFRVIKNIQGEINIQCNNKVPYDAFLTVNNINGQIVFRYKLKNIKLGNIISIHVPNSGINILSITTSYCKKSFKVLGSNENSNNFCYITNRIIEHQFEGGLPIEARIKNASIHNSNNFSFQNGDSIRISAYKHGYFSYPVGKRISGPDSVTFVFYAGEAPTAPVAEFTASPTSLIVYESVQFTDQSSNTPASWRWTFGDRGTSTQQNPSHTYYTAGTYEVSLTATNAYGSDTETKTNYITVSCNTGTVTDYEGNVYNTVKLGDQWWMAENLKATIYNDGVNIPIVTDETAWQGLSTHAYCWQNNNEAAYKNTYGALYNWYTVNTGNLCPTGWHVPTRPEWMVLDNYLILYGYNYDNSLTGNKIGKALASGSGWSFSSTDGAVGNTDYPVKRNVTCFSALPGGYRYYFGPFMGVGTEGHWWTSTVTTPASQAFSYYLGSTFISLNYAGMDKRCGYSVRCIKD